MKRKGTTLYPSLESNIDEQDLLPLNDSIRAAILSSLEKESPDRVAQSHIIVGAEGSGKTVLLGQIASELKESSSLEPILVSGSRLFGMDDIWKCCYGGCFNGVIDWQRQNGLRVVLLIDDIQYLFRRTDSAEQYSLRGKLSKAGAPILIATSNEVLPAFTDYNAAFFDGLKLSYIRPIDDALIASAGFSDREMPRVKSLMEYLPSTIRSLSMIKRVISLSASAADDVNVLCDLHASCFLLKYNSLVAQSQRILTVLATSDGMTMQQLRMATNQDSGTLSPYIKKLLNTNVIEKDSVTIRNATYRIKDTLFKLWLKKTARASDLGNW
jgi:hypothetical protein